MNAIGDDDDDILEADSVSVITLGTDSGAEPEPSVKVVVIQLSGQDLEDSVVILQMNADEAVDVADLLVAAAEEIS